LNQRPISRLQPEVQDCQGTPRHFQISGTSRLFNGHDSRLIPLLEFRRSTLSREEIVAAEIGDQRSDIRRRNFLAVCGLWQDCETEE
jgi:hypothetical protein